MLIAQPISKTAGQELPKARSLNDIYKFQILMTHIDDFSNEIFYEWL